MNLLEMIVMIALVALTTMATRFAPFIIFKSDKAPPKFLGYLGRALPPAVFGMLVVYCLKSVSLLAFPFGLPELIGVVVVVCLHLIFRKMLVSIIGGTGVYLVLVNLVFI